MRNKSLYITALMALMLTGYTYSQEIYTLYNYNGKAHTASTLYKVSYNKNGAILKSTKDTIYLGVNCDVLSSKYGKGLWWWANGGWGITFKNGNNLVSGARIDPPNIDGDKCWK